MIITNPKNMLKEFKANKREYFISIRKIKNQKQKS